ncbi:MAG TPA: DUF802 domain-containing protein, partial [Burkholderiaceae bacterium]|nr:DUF802 domain-containing protein [Burkholderiaceae bacterium]
SLRSAVRLRIQGERVGLPGPALAPYLTGLLVLLGMLGTFLGMVVTLRGTGLALESATDLQAIRASLAAPVQGLGFAFGTSIAGVATSAMLGLLSALCRRERIAATRLLDGSITTLLRRFSPAYQREEEFKLLQRQADASTVVVERLQAMMTAMEQHHRSLNDALVANQNGFHAKAETAYVGLAGAVDASLKAGITEGVRAAAAAIQPVVQDTMAALAFESTRLHDSVQEGVAQQLHGASRQLEALAGNMSETWSGMLSRHEAVADKLAASHRDALTAAVGALERHSATLLQQVDASHGDLRAMLASEDERRLAAWTEQMNATAATLRDEWQEAGARSARQQQEICAVLAQTAREMSSEAREHAGGTIAEIQRLVQAAGEAPRAAADVVAEVRQAFSDSMARDNAMLEERNRLLETLDTLLTALNRAASEQRGAVDALLAGSADALDRVGARFSDRIDAEAGKLTDVVGQATASAAAIAGSATEVASLGEAFGKSVQLFNESNTSLVEHLQRIEAALDKSLARSDEQLAYYVAQAREVVDLSIMSQKQIIEELQQLAAGQPAAGTVAA